MGRETTRECTARDRRTGEQYEKVTRVEAVIREPAAVFAGKVVVGDKRWAMQAPVVTSSLRAQTRLRHV